MTPDGTSIPNEASIPHRTRLRRVADAQRIAEQFEACNAPQRQLQGLLLSMLEYMQGTFRQPYQLAPLQRWWVPAQIYLQLLQSPMLATPGARKLLGETLSLTWAELEQSWLVHRVSRRASRAHRKRRHANQRSVAKQQRIRRLKTG